MTFIVRVFNTALFLAAWVGAFLALHWLVLNWLTQPLVPGQDLPPSFSVVVEIRANGQPPSWEARRFRNQAEFKLETGESLHLGTRTYDQTDHSISGSCCIAFRVLEDGPQGQLVELDYDDMSYVRSRYRVRDGQVVPISNRADFSLYYLGYFIGGGFVAWLLTRPLRRRALAWAKARSAAPPPPPA